MKKLLLLLVAVFLLLFYVWERSRSFQLIQTISGLEEKKRHGNEELSLLQTEIERLASFTRIEELARSLGLTFPEGNHGTDSTAQGR
jgi:cell division protein FtsL